MKRIEVLGHTQTGFHKLSCCAWPSWTESRQAVLCVHGLLRNGRDFDKLAAVLAKSRRVYCPDMAGRGFSEDLKNPADYTLAQYLADMPALLAATGALEVDWVGTSMGGLLGMLVAGQAGSPVRKLVLNDIGPFVPRASLQALGDALGKMPQRFETEKEIELFLRRNYASWGALDDEDWAVMACHSKRALAQGGFSLAYDPALRETFGGAAQDINLWETYDRINCPVLVLRGRTSTLLSEEVAQEMTRRGPCAKLVEIEGCGHAPSLMTQEQIRLIADFIEG